MGIINFSDFPDIREKYKDKKIVFCSGCFDLTHAGHILFLEDCKKLGDVLVVMVGRDSNVKKHKGLGRPILNEHIRMKIVSSLKPVDFCLLDLPAEKDNIMKGNLEAAFRSLRPDIYVINDDAFDMPVREELVKELDIPMKVLVRTAPPEFDDISTTKIIEKLKKLRE